MTNDLFRDVLNGKIPIARPIPRQKITFTWDMTMTEAQVDFISLAIGIPRAEARAFVNQMLGPPRLDLAPQRAGKTSTSYMMMSLGRATATAFNNPPPPQPETDPRKIALAAKAARGTGPRASASWRGNERSTKYRSQ